ncbi:helix-turn-helix domain-containing protein [Acuticoccus sp. MNP-M23]|uniref:helix-turn-helix transcriptional regulator n=1 Tax=Acuticoccus sp. MNP-M23 TaxID=3072793 RepID=UPI002815E92E|nr:helix-turn-helix domain-containing protein [Acuticoccus sp. MNP-M23]WMS42295.1 helix-turn-helix domain-containing protein [Acuticoccus sp. MNP-M23]
MTTTHEEIERAVERAVEKMRGTLRDELRAELLGQAPAEYLTTADVARIIGKTARSLEAMRERGEGPPFVRPTARTIRYPRAGVVAWMNQGAVQ